MADQTSRLTRGIFLLFLALIITQVMACKSPGSHHTLSAVSPEQNIKQVALLFREKEARLSAREVWQMHFTSYNKDLLDAEHEVYWVKFRIENPQEKEVTMYTSGFYTDRIDVYRYHAQTDSLVRQPTKNGYLVPPAERTVQYDQTSIAPIKVPPLSADTYLLRIHNYTNFGKTRAALSLQMGLILYDEAEFTDRYKFLTYSTIFMLGFMLIAVLYNTLIYTWIREKVFGCLALYSLASFSWVFLPGGMLISLGFIADLDLERYLRQHIPFLAIPLFYTLFCMTFLHAKKHTPKLYYLIWTLTGVHTVLALLYPFDYLLALGIQTKISPVIYTLFPVAAIIAWKKGQPNAGYLLAGSILFCLSVPVYVIGLQADSVNHLDGHTITQFCIMAETIVFSIATTRQMKIFKTAEIRALEEKAAIARKLEENSLKLIAYTTERIRQNEELEAIKRQISFENEHAAALTRRIEALMDFDTNWKSFRLYFENVHPGFFEILLRQYPDLTPNEERLCAFIKMGLTSKEIASLLGVTKRAVDKARERLKKKMKLNDSTNVKQVLKTIKV